MSNVKPNRKGSLCKWVLLALIIVCTLNSDCFFTDQFLAISGTEKTICLFIMLAASVGALSLAHIWNGSKS